MLPGSVASAGPWVWCFSASGHVAIESCGGLGCHDVSGHIADQNSEIHNSFDQIALGLAHDDCIDVELLPVSLLTTARTTTAAHSAATDLDFEPIIPVFGSGSRTVTSAVRTVSTGHRDNFRSESDPATQLRRITVLRI